MCAYIRRPQDKIQRGQTRFLYLKFIFLIVLVLSIYIFSPNVKARWKVVHQCSYVRVVRSVQAQLEICIRRTVNSLQRGSREEGGSDSGTREVGGSDSCRTLCGK